ncbi:MAG TPA: SpoIIIAH-like family protein [Anaerovoracaceae bacterium]|nr:SpoIIIAH-like family protein [Anaerovoracaceae bacterium]
MKFMKHKKIALVCMLVLIVGIGVLNNKLNNDQDLSASAGYTDYELEQMSLHDGDVLVDSVNVSEVPGTSSGGAVDPNATADPNAAADSNAPIDENAVVDTIAGADQNSDAIAATGAAIDSSMIVISDDISELANADTYYEEARATINMDRNQVISMLTDVIEETKDGSAEKNNATQQKLKIIDYMNKEKVIENLIKNKGFTDALVLMTDNSVNVTVNKQEITQSDVAKICDIVIRETGRDVSQIVIQSKY